MDKSQEQQYDEAFGQKDYNKSIHSFTAEEVSKMQSLDTIVQMGQMAEKMLGKYVQMDPLNRLAIKSNEDTRILYDIPTRRLVVYQPKILCNICQNRKGVQLYNDRIYCATCLEVEKLRENIKPKEEIKKKGGKNG